MPWVHESPADEGGAIESLADELTETNSTFDYPIDAIHEATLDGFFRGRASRQWEIDALNWEADRLYREMVRRPAKPFIDANRPSYAQLEQIRSDIYAGKK